jgi:hypothetical protein
MMFGADERRALAQLATAGRDGAAQAWLSAHGVDASMIAGLVNQGMGQSCGGGVGCGNACRSLSLSGVPMHHARKSPFAIPPHPDAPTDNEA